MADGAAAPETLDRGSWVLRRRSWGRGSTIRREPSPPSPLSRAQGEGQQTTQDMEADELMIRLTVNGKPKDVEQPDSLLALLEQIGVDPRIVAVERNGDIVRRVLFSETPISEGDHLEIVRMVGGG
jgi:sulfur carrier protein